MIVRLRRFVVRIATGSEAHRAMNHEAGCDVTLTFDKDAAGSDGFKELET